MDPNAQAGAPGLKKMLEEEGIEKTRASETPSAEAEASEADDSEFEASEADASKADTSKMNTSEVTDLDADTDNAKAVNGHSEEDEVDESQEKLVAETVIETITLEESDGLVTTTTTTTTTTIVSKVEEQGGMTMADSLDSVRRSMDSLNMCNTPDSLGGEEDRSTQEQLEQVLERATTIQSQVLESIVGVESEEMEAVKTDMAEVVEQEKTMITNDMKEIVESEERDKSVEVEVAELEVVEEIVEAGQKKGIVGLKEVLEKTESTEAETIEEEELVQTSENGITGLKEALEAPIKKEAAERDRNVSTTIGFGTMNHLWELLLR